MKSRSRALIVTAGLLSLGSAVTIAADLKSRVAREQIAQVVGLQKADAVHIKSISVTGGEAVVVAQFEAAFRFSDQNGSWKPVEVRTGDRQWESIELIQAAIAREKALRTTADLRTIATGLEAFRNETGGYVVGTGGAKLMDQLSPRYVKSIVRLDAWSHEFEYSGSRTGYRLASNGPDGKPGTGDDIVFENGQLTSGLSGD
jgi:hypothetical protein